jgi:hypothetical protein
MNKQYHGSRPEVHEQCGAFDREISQYGWQFLDGKLNGDAAANAWPAGFIWPLRQRLASAALPGP